MIKDIEERYERRIKADIPPIPLEDRHSAMRDFDAHALKDVEYLLSLVRKQREALLTIRKDTVVWHDLIDEALKENQ